MSQKQDRVPRRAARGPWNLITPRWAVGTPLHTVIRGPETSLSRVMAGGPPDHRFAERRFGMLTADQAWGSSVASSLEGDWGS